MPRYNRPFDITHRSDKIGDTSQRLVALRVQHMQDCAHQQGVARFFPMVAAFERPVPVGNLRPDKKVYAALTFINHLTE